MKRGAGERAPEGGDPRDATARIEALRSEVRDLDRRLIDLAAERLDLVRRIGAVKQEAGVPVRNYAVEAEIIADVRGRCEARGVDPAIGEALAKTLIGASLRVQERSLGEPLAPGSMGRAVVIGGAGGMGRWFCSFLQSKGYAVSSADPRGAPEGFEAVAPAEVPGGDFDVHVVSTPMRAAADVLAGLREGRVEGLVFDICSLKGPVEGDLRRLAKEGFAVTSLHPMWGPEADMLSGRNVLVVDCGVPAATRSGRALFEDTAATVVDVPLEKHDTLMAYTLGLPHAVALLFGEVVAESGLPLSDLLHLGGPTFTKQVAVSAEVAAEHRELYFDIQSLNTATPKIHEALDRALAGLEKAVADRALFLDLMGSVRAYFDEGRKVER